MATSHSLAKRSPIQRVDVISQRSSTSAPLRRIVTREGHEYPLEDVLEYLESASPQARDNFHLRQLNRAAELRAKLAEVVQDWIDVKALELFTSWTRPQLRKANGKHRSVPLQDADALPDDVHALDPFFRTRAEAKAIRRRLTVPQQKRWAAFFEKFGCHVCGTKVDHSGCGFCSTCYPRIRQRFETIGDHLRIQAAIGR